MRQPLSWEWRRRDVEKSLPGSGRDHLYGQTTPAGLAIKPQLEAKGYEVFAFHCNGTGGKAMEELAVEDCSDALLT